MKNNNCLLAIASICVGVATGAATYYSMKQNNKTEIEKTMEKHTGEPKPTMNFF